MNLTTRTSLTALATLCSAAALAPGAHASTVVTYDAEVFAQANWNQSQRTSGYEWSASSGAWFEWNTLVKVGHLRFVDGHLTGVTAEGKGQQMAAGKGTAEHHDKATGTTSGTCSLADQLTEDAEAMVGKPTWGRWDDELAAVAISSSDVSLDWTCDGKATPTVPYFFGSEPLDHDDTFGHRPLDAVFTIPKEIVGYGRIIQNVQGPPPESADYCPEKWYDGVQKCSFSWKGTVTLTKTGETTNDEPIDPGPTPPASGGQRPSSPPSWDLDMELPPLVVPSAKASTDAKASKVSFTAQCPAGCSGSAALTVAKGGGAAGAAAAKSVATMRFKGKGGAKARTITLKLPAKARRALRRAHRGSLRITLKQPGRVAVLRTLSVKVPRR